MKITIENTGQIVRLLESEGGRDLGHARVWVGRTESGIPVQLLVARVAVLETERQDEFQRELAVQAAPPPADLAFSLRMLI